MIVIIINLIKKSTTYTCTDGTVFVDDEFGAQCYQDNLTYITISQNLGISIKAAQWISTTYSGKKLLKKYNLNEEGVWIIRGEDLNCGMNGSHDSHPFIGKVSGKLSKVVDYAVQQKDFFIWGGGGFIEKSDYETVKKL